jgi:hypothetical protein
MDDRRKEAREGGEGDVRVSVLRAAERGWEGRRVGKRWQDLAFWGTRAVLRGPRKTIGKEEGKV